MEDDFVIPGDFIGTSEEFIPGNGTYDEDENIYAAVIGIVRENKKEKKVEIIPKTSVPSVIESGDIVLSRVTEVKESVVLVDIACIKGKEDREMATAEYGVIPISNVKNAYVSELGYEFGYMDIVRARVIDAKSMRLSTVGKDLGVIKSICKKCRAELIRNGNVLECQRCKRIETRNMSEDYGKGII